MAKYGNLSYADTNNMETFEFRFMYKMLLKILDEEKPKT